MEVKMKIVDSTDGLVSCPQVPKKKKKGDYATIYLLGGYAQGEVVEVHDDGTGTINPKLPNKELVKGKPN
ncbi:MAG: hypothetical protein ACI92I_000807 [Acidimicrobiales bacterium]